MFSIDDIKKSVTVGAKYLSASERSWPALLENALDYWILNYY